MRMLFGERIRHYRKTLNLTQQLLADRAGLSKAFISDVENGKMSMSVHHAKLIANVLFTSIDVLMHDEPSTL